ncbi:MAG: hypothetical protein C4520_18035 [Candidatus Abyssobacteria bacterium SURF_5]|uniref:Uncharacterized protein n=1 Tax=Abyssobacteria bacterium (strain SURF_5) TaxID=2093360 RepID=A0A3A4N407_ABYX5|nr:MAG: hypothetical protein C4520_18035 [Candidatus Abyssubacteria bacterium SURF_5]
MNMAAGIAVFGAVIVVSAVIWHFLCPQLLIASLGAAVTSAFIFQILAWVHIGYLDPFFIIAFVVTAFYALIPALLIGLPFLWLRVRRGPRTKNSDSEA